MSGVGEGTAQSAAARRLRRGSPRKERFWLSFDRRILYSIAGVVLVIGGLVFIAGVGVGRALAPLVPEGPSPAASVAPKPLEKVAPTPTPNPAAAEPAKVAAVDPPKTEAPKTEAPKTEAPKGDVPKVEAPPSLQLRAAPSDGYGLQLGAFETKADASVFLREHAVALGALPLHLVPTKIPKKGIWYRVRVGVFADKVSAETAKRQLDAELAKTAIVVSYR